MKVLNFGSLNLDYVYQVEHFVQPGETLSAGSQSINPGGKGLNQSIALAKAGAKVFHAGRVGVGGDMLLSCLNQNQVNTEFVLPTEEIQGNAVIQVTPTGENSILLFGGSNQVITKEQIDNTIEQFDAGDFLVLQNEINLLSYIVDKAHEKGMKIVLNPSPYNDKLKDVDFDKLSWLLVNEIEAKQISGSEFPDKAWEMLHSKYPNLSMVITLGKEGSIAYCSEVGFPCKIDGLSADERLFPISQKAYRVQAVDTTAAGDTFTGFFLAGLMEGKALSVCMDIAAKASAISVTRHGAAESIPTKEEVLLSDL